MSAEISFAYLVHMGQYEMSEQAAEGSPSCLKGFMPSAFAVTLLRVVSSVLIIIVAIGSLGFSLLGRLFKQLVKRAYASDARYQAIPSPEEGVATPFEDAATSPAQDAIIPVVVGRRIPRQGVIVGLLFVTASTFLIGEGAIFVAKAILDRQWEGKDALFKFQELYVLGNGLALAAVTLALARDRSPFKSKGAWKAWFPVITVFLCLCADTGLLATLLSQLGKR